MLRCKVGNSFYIKRTWNTLYKVSPSQQQQQKPPPPPHRRPLLLLLALHKVWCVHAASYTRTFTYTHTAIHVCAVVVVFDIPVRHWIMALGCVKPSIQSAARYSVARCCSSCSCCNKASAMFKWSTNRWHTLTHTHRRCMCVRLFIICCSFLCCCCHCRATYSRRTNRQAKRRWRHRTSSSARLERSTHSHTHAHTHS